MPYAVELYFDMESSEKIDALRNKLEVNGISTDKGTKPHISLAIYDDIEILEIEVLLQHLQKAFSLATDGLIEYIGGIVKWTLALN